VNATLSTFLKIAITVISISAFLFFIGYNMIGTETTSYKTNISSMKSNLPAGTGSTTNSTTP
jgi:hypothetical protein